MHAFALDDVAIPTTGRPPLRLVTGGGSTSGGSTPGRGTILRRRLVALTLLVLVVTAAALTVGRIGAEAELADRVAGHVVIAPGETLWDVAVATTPDGVDPRAQLDALRDLNGLRGTDVAAWTVVRLPAR